METYNYTTYCSECGHINVVKIPIEFRLKPFDYLEKNEVICENINCKSKIII